MFSDKAKLYCERLGGKARARKASVSVSVASPSPSSALSPPLLHVPENTNINPVSVTDPASTTSVATKHSSSDTSRESFALPPRPIDSKTIPFSGFASLIASD